MMLLPYINTRVLASRNSKTIKLSTSDFSRKGDTIEYPEELHYKEKPMLDKIVADKALQNKFFEGLEDFDISSRFAKPNASEAAEGGDEE